MICSNIVTKIILSKSTDNIQCMIAMYKINIIEILDVMETIEKLFLYLILIVFFDCIMGAFLIFLIA